MFQVSKNSDFKQLFVSPLMEASVVTGPFIVPENQVAPAISSLSCTLGRSRPTGLGVREPHFPLWHKHGVAFDKPLQAHGPRLVLWHLTYMSDSFKIKKKTEKEKWLFS